MQVLPLQSQSSGIGRRMSALLFGSSPIHGIRLLNTIPIDRQQFLAITAQKLQSWSIIERMMIWEADPTIELANCAMTHIWV